MIERESRLPLVLGAAVALLLHAVLLPVWAVGIQGITDRSPIRPPKQDRPMPTPRELDVGRAEASVSNVAWIPYEAFQELLAEHSIVEQPALQKQEDPAPQAPIEMDPTPPSPVDPLDPTRSTPGAKPHARQTPSPPISRQIPVPLPKPTDLGQVPYAPQGPMPKDAVAVVPDAPDPAKQQPSDQPTDNPGAAANSAKPTAAPKSDREAPPVTIIPGIVEVRPGEVLVGDGLEIKTVVPRPSTIARVSTIPRNPQATLSFNPKGEVVNVVLTKSTGADNWDDPVKSSLYKWTATGERIDNLEGELQLKVKLLLRRSR